MERLTNTAWRNFDPWECCGQDHYCTRGCHDDGGCNNGCIVPKLYSRLSAYEDFMDRWHLKSIEDAERIFRRVNDLGGTDLMAQYRELGSINHLRDLLQAEQDGRLVVLPFELHSSMMNLSDPKNPGLMNDVRLSVSWTTSGIVFNAPYDFFLQDMKRGYIKPVSKEAEAARAGKGGAK